MEMTKRLGAERLKLVAATGFCVLALAGTVAGRDIALLLVPTAVVPLLLIVRTFMYKGAGKWNPSCMILAVYDIFHAGLATALACSLSFELTSGRCPWAAGAMAAAMSSIATVHPFSRHVRHPSVQTSAMLSSSVFYVASAFASGGKIDVVGFGTVFAIPLYSIARIALAVRDRRRCERKEAAA